MFSGIVETMAQVVKIETEQTNKHFTLRNPFGEPLSIDQSIAHNGVCLTVVRIEGDLYTVTAMQETLRLTNLDLLKVGDFVNVERSMLMGGRLDGHIVQGHVDQKAVCIDAHETDGSWYYRFEYDSTKEMVERGYFLFLRGQRIGDHQRRQPDGLRARHPRQQRIRVGLHHSLYRGEYELQVHRGRHGRQPRVRHPRQIYGEISLTNEPNE